MKNTLVAVFGIIVACILGEFLIRIAVPVSYVSDSKLGMIGSGGEHDARGFRNAVALSQASIVVLGDSQTYGNNAERDDAWPQQLGKIASTTVYQMAFGGYSALQYRDLMDEGIALHPNILIVAFYAGNDLLETYTGVYDSGNSKWNKRRDPGFVPPATTSDPLTYRQELQTGLSRNTVEFSVWRVRYWMRLHSRLYAFLGDITREIRERVGIAKTMKEKHQQFTDFAKEHPEIAYIFKENEKLRTIMSPAYRLEAVSLDEPRAKEGWRITKEIFQEMSEKARMEHIPLIFLYIPTKEFAYLEYMRLSSVQIPGEFHGYYAAESRLQDEFLKNCYKLGDYCFSVTSALAEALRLGEKVYGETMDGHPLALGYQVIASSTWEYLRNTSVQRPGRGEINK